jgi:hypothetical protein
MKTVTVGTKALSLLFIKSDDARNMSLEEIGALKYWCDCQCASLWERMTTQEILNVYRVSAHWETWEAWQEEEGEAARKAWDMVVNPVNYWV